MFSHRFCKFRRLTQSASRTKPSPAHTKKWSSPVQYLAFRSTLWPFFGREMAEISRSSCREFTHDGCYEPLLEPYIQATNARFLPFALIFPPSPQKCCEFDP